MSRRRDVALFLALAVAWGLSFPAIAVGLEYLPPFGFAALRYGVAAVLLLAVAVVAIDNWRPSERADLLAIVGAGVFLVGGNGLLFVGQQTVPSGVAAILQALVPIATALWAVFLLGERLSPTGMAGVVVGFLGIALVVQPDPAALFATDTVARLLIVGQVACVSLGGVIVQWAEPSMDRVPLTGWTMAVGTCLLAAASLGTGEAAGAAATEPVALAAIAYLGIVSTALAFVVFYWIIEVRGAFEASLVGYLVPVVATIVGVLFLDEAIGVLTVAGFGLVAVGFALLKREALADLADGITAMPRP